MKTFHAVFELTDTTKEELKSTWKEKVKTRIAEEKEKSKARTVLKSEYEMKQYLKETRASQATRILMARLHMIQLPCNYKKEEEDKRCPLCQMVNIRTEHYFHCAMTEKLRKSWGTTETDLQSDDACVLLRATNFLEAVSRRIQPRWKDSDEFKINRTTQISPYKPLTNNIHKKTTNKIQNKIYT